MFSQTITTDNKLIIPHGDITLYLTKDTCTFISKHVLKLSSFLKLDKERDNKWFQDTYKGKYTKDSYLKTGYDIGHLTPSHITSYDNALNHLSFSLFNAAPQLAAFNRGKWAQMEGDVEDIIAKSKQDAVIITGVIYDPTNIKFMGKSRIPIPQSFFKVLFLNGTSRCWIGSNINGLIVTVTLKDLNELFKKNKMNLVIQ
jgi:DNA/RNA endonuclease G (NUC1)